MGDEKKFLTFSEALELMKEGYITSREAWNNPTIKVLLQKPDENSKMTEPYLYMEKGTPEKDFKRFPLDLSCESILADDWFVVKTGK